MDYKDLLIGILQLYNATQLWTELLGNVKQFHLCAELPRKRICEKDTGNVGKGK
jgi:hypothetical protein